MNSEDKTVEILKELEKETINMKILNEKEGKEYLEHLTIQKFVIDYEKLYI